MSFTLDQLLIFAARAGNLPVAGERLAMGADPNFFDPVHGSAAMAAVSNGNEEMLGLLLDSGLTAYGPAAVSQIGLIEHALQHQQERMAVLLAHRGFHLLARSRPIYREPLQRLLKTHGRVEPLRPANGG